MDLCEYPFVVNLFIWTAIMIALALGTTHLLKRIAGYELIQQDRSMIFMFMGIMAAQNLARLMPFCG